MAYSIAFIVLTGLFSDFAARKLRMPGLIGMLVAGIVLGPYVLNVIDKELLNVSSDFRMIALIVILLRAGLETGKDTLNKVGKTALLLSFIPALLEGAAITLIAPELLGITTLEAAMLGAIIAAVSPAVVVPYMIKFIEEKRGTRKGIPTMMLAASSVDDVFVIVVFSMLLGIHAGGKTDYIMKLLDVPASIALGVVLGGVVGFAIYLIFKKYGPRATKKALIVIGAAIFLTWVEEKLRSFVPVSALLGVMTIGFILLEKSGDMAHAVSRKLSKIWVFAEILLFVLVGAQVNIHVAWDAGLAGGAVILLGLVARSAGTFVSVIRAGLNLKERLFCVIAYVPKATVQAAIGAVPLSQGVKGGEVILAVAVLSILLTAPLGAIGIEKTGPRLLEKDAA